MGFSRARRRNGGNACRLVERARPLSLRHAEAILRGVIASGARLFLDTSYVQALLNPRDSQHPRALSLLPRVKTASEVVITEAVFAEVGNALSRTPMLRQVTAAFIRHCYTEANTAVISVDTSLLSRALELFERRVDKTWGLTDCISFVVMRDRGLMDAATGDRHFQQAGFRALMVSAES
ncbi:MAG TPA: PIN domain-containing protein [Longimicrobium sp.]|nr:PIN domain-containing protein [Longimicrobium sp.]